MLLKVGQPSAMMWYEWEDIEEDSQKTKRLLHKIGWMTLAKIKNIRNREGHPKVV